MLQDCATIYAGNHHLVNDPFVMGVPVFRCSGNRIVLRFMMRIDFFEGTILRRSLLDLESILAMCGTWFINRDNIQLSQLKRFVNWLRTKGSILMYPGRTRTRSGLLMEYREGIPEFGSVSFLLAQAQRLDKELTAASVPVTRTFNPVSVRSTVAFGEAVYLSPTASRSEQREFDYEVLHRMADLVEINVPHLASLVLYLTALHARGDLISISDLKHKIEKILPRLKNRHVAPEVKQHLSKELAATLKFLQKRGMIDQQKNTISLHKEAILASPGIDGNYKKLNPVKYLTNQILHLPDLIMAAEDTILDIATQPSPN